MDEQPFAISDFIKLSQREVRTIELLGQSGGVNVTNVSTHFNFTKSAASQLVNRLVQRDLVYKEISEFSDKEFRLTLSPEGEKALRLIKVMTKKRLEAFLERTKDFSSQEIVATESVLNEIEKMMNERLNQLK